MGCLARAASLTEDHAETPCDDATLVSCRSGPMKKRIRDIFDQPSQRFSEHAPGARSASSRPTARPPRRSVRPPPDSQALRRALVLVVRKLEAMGIDCSDVTEIIGDSDT